MGLQSLHALGSAAASPRASITSAPSIPPQRHHVHPFVPSFYSTLRGAGSKTQNRGSAALLDSPWLKGCLEAKRNETVGIGQVSLLSVWKLNIKPKKNFPGADMNPDIILLCRYGKIQPAIFNFLDMQATRFSFRVGKQR